MITLTTTGVNSAVLEYTNGETYTNLMIQVNAFIVAHGQTLTDATSAGQTASPQSLCRAYKALNLDGTTYKYMVVGIQSGTTSGIGVRACENYVETGHVLTNPSYNMDYISYVQRMSANTTLTDNNGRLYLFANERFFFMYHSGTACIGSYSGSGGEGVFEIDRANLQDTTPSHFWMNSYLATGANNANYYYMISPVRTFSKTGITASYYNRFCTPVGAQGYLQNYMFVSISSFPSPVGTVIKHQIYDPTIVLDCDSQMWVKGKVCCLKVFTTNTGVIGDIFRVKCDANYFLSTTGTDKDWFLIRMATSGTFAVPL